jgi:Flp pilus assembly protein TadD
MASITTDHLGLLHHILRSSGNVLKYGVLVFIVVGLVACASQQEQSSIVGGENSSAEAHGQNQSPSASERYQTKSTFVPPAVQALLNEAELAMNNEHYARAESQLSKAQRLSPTLSKTYLLWGHLYKVKGSATHAEQMYKRALSLATDETQTSLAEAALNALLTE